MLSSVASDAGYLILVPLGAAAFASVGRHPLAGMAACFAGVGAIFTVNPILTPIDAMLTEITNEAIGTVAGGDAPHDRRQLLVQHRVVGRAGAGRRDRHRADRRAAPGPVDASVGQRADAASPASDEADDQPDAAANKKGLRYALFGFLGFLALVLLITIPEGAAAPRPGHGRHHRHHAVHGQPAVHHRDVLPDLGHRLRHGRRDVQERRTT